MIMEKKKIFIIKRHNNYLFLFIILLVIIKMKVKIFDESHESDLEEDINKFISDKKPNIIDIKYSVSSSAYADEQIYCFSALIIYKEVQKN